MHRTVTKDIPLTTGRWQKRWGGGGEREKEGGGGERERERERERETIDKVEH